MNFCSSHPSPLNGDSIMTTPTIDNSVNNIQLCVDKSTKPQEIDHEVINDEDTAMTAHDLIPICALDGVDYPDRCAGSPNDKLELHLDEHSAFELAKQSQEACDRSVSPSLTQIAHQPLPSFAPKEGDFNPFAMPTFKPLTTIADEFSAGSSRAEETVAVSTVNHYVGTGSPPRHRRHRATSKHSTDKTMVHFVPMAPTSLTSNSQTYSADFSMEGNPLRPTFNEEVASLNPSTAFPPPTTDTAQHCVWCHPEENPEENEPCALSVEPKTQRN